VLEDNLLGFPGALVLVTHDRYLLDRVCTAIVGLDGRAGRTVRGYRSMGEGGVASVAAAREFSPHRGANASRRRSCRLSRSASGPDRGAILRRKKRCGLRRRAAESEGIANPAVMHARHDARCAQAESDRLYARWAELESKLAG